MMPALAQEGVMRCAMSIEWTALRRKLDRISPD